MQALNKEYPESRVSHISISPSEHVREFLQSSNQWPVVIKSCVVLSYFSLDYGPCCCRLFIVIEPFEHGCDSLPAERAC